MLWTIAALLTALWVLGMTISYSMGGVLHLLLIAAAFLVVLRFMSRQTVLS